MKQIIAYTRVSTQKQGVSGLGLEAQRDAIARFAKAEGCMIAGAFTEVETGKGLTPSTAARSSPPPSKPPASSASPWLSASSIDCPATCISFPG